ncbi:hypothetical protein EYF80_034854 [Liparis tanakae]|uniref:Uncharacterized protein n=1 Tax=Liparis tanakae TaxID=230148 RepID=A0A4Z2GNI3_9TELE|nr:hypothetical protein EYF80_034854 [Liparis tanakae]
MDKHKGRSALSRSAFGVSRCSPSPLDRTSPVSTHGSAAAGQPLVGTARIHSDQSQCASARDAPCSPKRAELNSDWTTVERRRHHAQLQPPKKEKCATRTSRAWRVGLELTR